MAQDKKTPKVYPHQGLTDGRQTLPEKGLEDQLSEEDLTHQLDKELSERERIGSQARTQTPAKPDNNSELARSYEERLNSQKEMYEARLKQKDAEFSALRAEYELKLEVSDRQIKKLKHDLNFNNLAEQTINDTVAEKERLLEQKLKSKEAEMKLNADKQAKRDLYKKNINNYSKLLKGVEAGDLSKLPDALDKSKRKDKYREMFSESIVKYFAGKDEHIVKFSLKSAGISYDDIEYIQDIIASSKK